MVVGDNSENRCGAWYIEDMQEETTPQEPVKVKRKRSYTPHPIEPTPLQRRAAIEVSKVIKGNSNARTSKEILSRAGYSPSQAERSTVVMRSQGMVAALNELGLTKEKVVPMLLDDLENNPGKRWLGLSIAGKWLGLEQREEKQQGIVANNSVIIIQRPNEATE